MCGISVIVALDAHPCGNHVEGANGNVRSRISKQLDESLDKIAHRGPDSRGQWISKDNRVGNEL